MTTNTKLRIKQAGFIALMLLILVGGVVFIIFQAHLVKQSLGETEAAASIVAPIRALKPVSAVAPKPAPKRHQLAPTNGTIQGSLTYPSSSVPASIIGCARSHATGKTYCSDGQVVSQSYVYGVGYTITVPPGTYWVYASSSDSDFAKNRQFPAYYNTYMRDFARRNSWPDYPTTTGASCNTLKNLPVTVAAGDTIKHIDLGDWYYSTQCR